MDPWLQGLWSAIKQALTKMASGGIAHSKQDAGDSAKETPDSSIPDVQLNLLSLTDHQNCGSVGISVNTDSKSASAASSSTSATQTAVSDLRPASSAESPKLASKSSDTASVSTSVPEANDRDAGVSHIALAASLTASLPPLSESSLNVPALPPPYLDVSLQCVHPTEQVYRGMILLRKTSFVPNLQQSCISCLFVFFQIDGPLNKGTLHEVPISRAVQLTRGDSVKKALLLELDISVSLTEKG